MLPSITTTLSDVEKPTENVLAPPGASEQLRKLMSTLTVKERAPAPLYRNVGTEIPTGKHRLPYESRVSFDTVTVDVSDTTGVDPVEYPDYFGLTPEEAKNHQFLPVPPLGSRLEVDKKELVSMESSQYRRYLKGLRKDVEITQAMHNQVCCFLRQHKNFNGLYRNFENRDLNRTNAPMPEFPRRTILVYISGRRHTWVALDWTLRKLLADGDHMVVVALIFPELVDQQLKNSDDDDYYEDRRNRFQSVSSLTPTRLVLRSPMRSYSSGPRGTSKRRHHTDFEKTKAEEVRKKAEDIMRYITVVSDPKRIVKITIDLSVGTSKNVLKDSYILYTPTLLVCSAKPKRGAEPTRSWLTSRFSDRVVKNFTIPVIIVPALNMNRFEKHLFEMLLSQVQKNGEEKKDQETKASAASAPPSLSGIKIDLPENKDKSLANGSSHLANPASYTPLHTKTLTEASTPGLEREGSADSKDTGSIDSNSSLSVSSEEEEELLRRERRRPRLNRLKTLIAEMNYEDEPDLTTTAQISKFVNRQENLLSENLRKIPYYLTDSMLSTISPYPRVDENYFKNQLELITLASLHITKKLKRLDFSDDKESAELVHKITGDPTVVRNKPYDMFANVDLSSVSLASSRRPALSLKWAPAPEKKSPMVPVSPSSPVKQERLLSREPESVSRSSMDSSGKKSIFGLKRVVSGQERTGTKEEDLRVVRSHGGEKESNGKRKRRLFGWRR